MDRIKEILDKMCQLSPRFAIEPIDDFQETQEELDSSEQQDEDVFVSSDELAEQMAQGRKPDSELD